MSRHVESAEAWIENAANAQASTNPNNEQLATAYAGIGQVYATLALVEQQRIANVIAWTAGAGYEPSQAVIAEVTEALELS